MDSDSDLQAYINELSKKTHDLKYGDHESTSSDEPEPSHSSYIEIAVKKTVENIEKQSAQTSKVKELEEKYLKRSLKSKEPNLSSSFSEYNPEFEEEKLNTDNINTFPDETTIDSNENKNIQATQIHETLNSIDNDRSTKQIVNLKSHSFEEDVKEDSYLASQNSSQRKLSDSSSLLNKSSIFYSKNEKAGRQKPTGKIIFRMRSSTLSESDSIKTDVTSSVSEEIPELMQNQKKEATMNNQMSTEDKEESNSYEENTFENSEDSSTIKNERSSSKLTSESALSQKSNSKSVTESAVSEQASSEMSERDENISERVTSSKGQSSTSNTEETNESHNNTEKSDDVISQDDSTQNTSVKSQVDRSSPNESSSITGESNEFSIQHTQKIQKSRHKSKNKIVYGTPEISPRPSKSRVKDSKKRNRENNVDKRSKMEQDFSSSTSLSTSVVTSSSSSSFYVKMKKKKYREKKRKVKQEKELTELIIKLLIKNLPVILRQTLGINSTAELLHQQPRTYICHHCGGNSIGFDMTQKRIDDALRQTVDLTKHFLESQKTMMETQYTHLNANYKYTTLKNYST